MTSKTRGPSAVKREFKTIQWIVEKIQPSTASTGCQQPSVQGYPFTHPTASQQSTSSGYRLILQNIFLQSAYILSLELCGCEGAWILELSKWLFQKCHRFPFTTTATSTTLQTIQPSTATASTRTRQSVPTSTSTTSTTTGTTTSTTTLQTIQPSTSTAGTTTLQSGPTSTSTTSPATQQSGSLETHAPQYQFKEYALSQYNLSTLQPGQWLDDQVIQYISHSLNLSLAKCKLYYNILLL